MHTLHLGEFFCGPGGIGLGALRAKLSSSRHAYSFRHAWANDYDQDTCDTFQRNICPDEHAEIFCGDVRALDISKLKPIDGFAFGFPCNDFSLVGQHRGFDGEFGPLYTYGVNVLNRLKPKFFLAENVGGIRSANEGGAFRKILSDLSKAGNGYILTPHYYKFEEYGVPQTRHRVVIIGMDKTLGLRFAVPAPTTTHKHRTAFEALNVPPVPMDAFNHELTKQAQRVVERLKYIKPGENVWNANLPDELKLNVKKTRMSQIYKRLDPSKPAYTITGSGGGGTHVYHWDEPRALTNRERARLQSFPDDFVFSGSKESVRKQIGMAVPPVAAEAILTAVLRTFAGESYPSVPSNLLSFLAQESKLNNVDKSQIVLAM
jgi:DNA (cytosine-5)-methyltransferase 1